MPKILKQHKIQFQFFLVSTRPVISAYINDYKFFCFLVGLILYVSIVKLNLFSALVLIRHISHAAVCK